MAIKKHPSIIFGLVSRRGCGKDVCSKYIVNHYRSKEIVMSSYIGDALDFFQLPHNRKNIAWFITKIRSRFGKGILARAVIREIGEDGFSIYILNGVRLLREVEILREMFGKDFVLVDIVCDDKIRFERIKKREKKLKVSKDNVKISFEDFIKQENRIITEKEITAIKKKADFTIDNNGTERELYRRLDNLIKNFGVPKLKP